MLHVEWPHQPSSCVLSWIHPQPLQGCDDIQSLWSGWSGWSGQLWAALNLSGTFQHPPFVWTVMGLNVLKTLNVVYVSYGPIVLQTSRTLIFFYNPSAVEFAGNRLKWTASSHPLQVLYVYAVVESKKTISGQFLPLWAAYKLKHVLVPGYHSLFGRDLLKGVPSAQSLGGHR